MLLKTALVLTIGSLSVAIGEALVSVGMKKIGDVSINPTQFWRLFTLFVNPHVLLGMLFMIVFFLCYAAALSWADLSYAMPWTSLAFVFGTLIGKFFLNEEVSIWRWSGCFLVMLGIMSVAMDKRVLTVEIK